MKQIPHVIILALVAAMSASCVSVKQQLILAPVDNQFPVSATKSIAYGGRIVSEQEIAKKEPFVASLSVAYPLGQKAPVADITGALDKQIAGSGYNGITQLKVKVTSFDNRALAWCMSAEQDLGIASAILGGFYLLVGYSSETLTARNETLATGYGFAGAGGALIATSILTGMFGKVNYQLSVSGMKIAF